MSQIQSGYNYNTSSNKIVTAENLNGSVNNAILLPGSVSEQQTLTDPVETTDKFVLLDSSSGLLTNTTIQSVFDVLPTDLPISSINALENQDIYINQNAANNGTDAPNKINIGANVFIGTPEDVVLVPQHLAVENSTIPGTGPLLGGGILGVQKIVNPIAGGDNTSYIVFGYDFNEQPGGLRANRFTFLGFDTTFAGTDNLATGNSNDTHNVTIQKGDFALLNGDINVTGDINATGDIVSNGVTLSQYLPRAMGRFDKDGIPLGTKNFNIVCLRTENGGYDLTFDTPMEDEHYIVLLTGINQHSYMWTIGEELNSRTVNGFKIKTTKSGFAGEDMPFNVVVF